MAAGTVPPSKPGGSEPRPSTGPIGDSEHPPSYDPLYEFGHGLSYTEFERGEVVRPSRARLGSGDDRRESAGDETVSVTVGGEYL